MRLKTSIIFSILSDFIDEVGKGTYYGFLSDFRNNILNLTKKFPKTEK